MAFFSSKRKLRPKDEAEVGELNAVPYLDILMNLILFMLLSISGLATFGVVNASTARAATGGDGDVPPTLAISSRGFTVGPDFVPVTNFTGLTERMIALKRQRPAETRLVLSADPDVPYEVIVAAMDAVRETPGHAVLFPDLTLSAR